MFKSDWRQRFAEIRHEISGTPISNLSETLKDIEAATIKEFTASIGTAALVADSDPVRFSLRYLTMIDLGIIPVPISHELPTGTIKSLRSRIAGWTLGEYACLTSGTTSTPKLCAFSVQGAMANAKAHATSLGITSDHKIVQALPVHHSFGLVCYLWTALTSGCAIDFQIASPGIAALSAKSEEYAVYLSPAQARFFSKMKNRASMNLSIASVGGGGLACKEAESFMELFKNSNHFVTYGLTEAGPRVSTGKMHCDFTDGAYIGRALPGVEVFVTQRDENGQSSPEGEGRLCVRSPSLKKNLESTELAKDGSLMTRDHVRIVNGDIYFLSRESDLINVGGVSIYPGDIEAVARSCDGIRDCIVLKVRDAIYEETPVLVAEGDVSKSEVWDHLTKNLSPAQMPKQVFVVQEMPRQSLNKIDRITLLGKLGLDGS